MWKEMSLMHNEKLLKQFTDFLKIIGYVNKSTFLHNLVEINHWYKHKRKKI